MSAMSPSERRGAARAAVVWDALRAQLDHPAGAPLEVVDVGGGTGGLAVRVAELGHHVTVVDPSPDALAALARRAEEKGVATSVRGVQGDLSDLPVTLGSDEVDAVLCHGVLEVAGEPAAALTALAAVLRPGGLVSLVVAQRHAAVVARAMAGHLGHARELLDAAPASAEAVPDARTGARSRRFTHAELRGLADSVGLDVVSVHGVNVFSDLVPGALLDLEPGATRALVELEHAVSDREEFFPLATRLHLLARTRP